MSKKHKQREAEFLRTTNPLVVARAALDLVCDDEQKLAHSQLQKGAPFDELLRKAADHPLRSAASVVLDASLESPNHSWTDWIHLKTGLVSMQQRIMTPILFSHETEFQAQRASVHTDAYTQYGLLLEEVCSLQSDYTSPEDIQQFKGSVGELVTLALLNRVSPSKAGARISTALADRLYKVDARYNYFDKSQSTARSANIQVKTYAKTCVLPNKILQFGIFSVLHEPYNSGETADLIVRDVHDDLSAVERTQLTQRAATVKSVIHSAIGAGVLTNS